MQNKKKIMEFVVCHDTPMNKLDFSTKVRARQFKEKINLPSVGLSCSIYNGVLSRIFVILLGLGFYFLYPFRNCTLKGWIGPLRMF